MYVGGVVEMEVMNSDEASDLLIKGNNDCNNRGFIFFMLD